MEWNNILKNIFLHDFELLFNKINKNQRVTKYRYYRNSLNIQHNFREP
jgi:hypothetical protein